MDVKRIAFILAIFYFFSAVGYGMQFHYCGDTLTDFNYVLFDTSCGCNAADEHVMPSCCDEESFFNQLSDEHQAADQSKVTAVPVTGLFEAHALNKADDAPEVAVVLSTDRAPPPIRNLKLMNQQHIDYE